MDYNALAEELISTRTGMHQMQVERQMSRSVRGELFVLNFLFAQGTTAYPKEISRGMMVSTARIAVILRNLEQEGLITRAADAEDNRQIIVTLTEKGIAAIKAQRQELQERIVEMLKVLGPDDAREFVRLQKKLANNFPVK